MKTGFYRLLLNKEMTEEQKERFLEFNSENYLKNKDEIAKLLLESTKDGEYYIFTRQAEGGFGMILSNERLENIPGNINDTFNEVKNITKIFTSKNN